MLSSLHFIGSSLTSFRYSYLNISTFVSKKVVINKGSSNLDLTYIVLRMCSRSNYLGTSSYISSGSSSSSYIGVSNFVVWYTVIFSGSSRGSGIGGGMIFRNCTVCFTYDANIDAALPTFWGDFLTPVLWSSAMIVWILGRSIRYGDSPGDLGYLLTLDYS